MVDTEVQIPGTGRALDILARVPSGELVAIENQFATADHDHLTRGLSYAVGLEATALVVVAESHLDEFRAVARYLNELAERSDADRRIGVYLVGPSAERVGEYVIPRLIESPNPWVTAATTAKPAAIQSVEELLDKAPSSVRETVRDIVAWWDAQPAGSVRYGALTAISLDRPHPIKPSRPLSHIVLYLNGSYAVNRVATSSLRRLSWKTAPRSSTNS